MAGREAGHGREARRRAGKRRHLHAGGCGGLQRGAKHGTRLQTRVLGRGKPELTGEPLLAKPPAKSRSGWVWLALSALFLLAILMH